MPMALSRDEFYRLVQAADTVGQLDMGSTLRTLPQRMYRAAFLSGRDVLILALAGEAGLRIGEIERLDWPDLLHAGLPKLVLVIKSGHGGNTEREVPVSPLLGAAILRYAKYHAWLRGPVPFAGPVCTFYGKKGRLKRRAIQRMVSRLGLKVLGRKVWPHMLRHTFASRMLGHSDVRTVQALLGHTRLETTQRYLHTSRAAVDSAILQLGKNA